MKSSKEIKEDNEAFACELYDYKRIGPYIFEIEDWNNKNHRGLSAHLRTFSFLYREYIEG